MNKSFMNKLDQIEKLAREEQKLEDEEIRS